MTHKEIGKCHKSNMNHFQRTIEKKSRAREEEKQRRKTSFGAKRESEREKRTKLN